MKYLPILLLTGCQSLTTVSFDVKCKDMHGELGNSCKITVPSNADVKVTGETILISYEGNE